MLRSSSLPERYIIRLSLLLRLLGRPLLRTTLLLILQDLHYALNGDTIRRLAYHFYDGRNLFKYLFHVHKSSFKLLNIARKDITNDISATSMICYLCERTVCLALLDPWSEAKYIEPLRSDIGNIRALYRRI